jgi:transcriptional regulator with XRE-family HTH domain
LKKAPNHVDRHVGSRVRLRRMLLGLTQERLGEALGLTFQQVQKYEKGTNRIGASRLQQISQFLKVEIAYFFEGPVGREAAGWLRRRGHHLCNGLSEQQRGLAAESGVRPDQGSTRQAPADCARQCAGQSRRSGGTGSPAPRAQAHGSINRTFPPFWLDETNASMPRLPPT